MKSFKLLVAGAFVLALFAPVMVGGVAHAQEFLECDTGNNEFPESGACDLAILKEVSINSGAFVDANTSPEAANATVGDTVTWRITVTDGFTGGDFGDPLGTVLISDILPAGFSLTNSNPSDGTFDEGTDIWTLPLITYFGPEEGSADNLPAVLILTTIAAGTGLFENIASFVEFDSCQDECFDPYFDDFDVNNQDSAWVNIAAAPVVLAETTPQVLADTGDGMIESLAAAGLIGATLLSLGYYRFARREN